jgi:hypothetical protein
VHLRVELQGLWRLPRSNAIVFSIRCHLIALHERATVPKGARRLRRVLLTLLSEIVEYRRLTRYREAAIARLRAGMSAAPVASLTLSGGRRLACRPIRASNLCSPC